jgi:hypothetical protein
MPDPIDLHFESAAPAALRAWLASMGWTGQMGERGQNMDPRVLDFGVFVEIPVAGVQMAFVHIAAAEQIDPPPGISRSILGASVTGATMVGPALPTTLQWMDRLPRTRQAALLDALDALPEGRLFLRRMLAAGEIDPRLPETIQGVTALHAMGQLSDEERDALLAV